MIPRHLLPSVLKRLEQFPAVVLLGPRQVGKTALAAKIAATRPSVRLDLERPAERAQLADPELFLRDHEDKLLILDEIQRMPRLFPTLRGVMDEGRSRGLRAGRFFLIGSASLDRFRQSGESLAGRVANVELGPLRDFEVASGARRMLWIRGGFPDSLLADGDGASVQWRENFIRTYLERDVPQFGPRLPAETLRRFWTMLAHSQGAPLNAARLAHSLGVNVRTVSRYVDLLVDLLLVRRLPPWRANVGKRLVKAPKVFVRDSGLVHSLLRLDDRKAVLGHPVAGPSWEGFVVENLLAAAPDRTQGWFYRTAAGAEIDLVLEMGGGELWAVEVKRSLAPALDRGFHHAREDLRPARSFVVYPGDDRYRVAEGVEVISLWELARVLLGVAS